jgi:hypothetical protein
VRLAAASQKQSEGGPEGRIVDGKDHRLCDLWIGALFGHNLAHGKQKTIDEKTIMSAFVAHNVHVHRANIRFPPGMASTIESGQDQSRTIADISGAAVRAARPPSRKLTIPDRALLRYS